MIKVLLIEDDPWLADSYTQMLEADKTCEVAVAHSGEQAVEIVDDGRLPDVMLADFMLGEANVLTLLHELQSYSDTAKVPVVLCSAVDIRSFASKKALSHYGIYEILDKTMIVPDDLRRAVKAAAKESQE